MDEPQIEGLVPTIARATTKVGYIRFHGRNSAGWWDGMKDRYNYLYSEDQLKEWLEKTRNMGKTTEKTFVFFNNCPYAQAAKNAQMMKKLLEEAK